MLIRTPHGQLKIVYAELGNRKRMIRLLRETCDEDRSWFAGSRYDPPFGALTSDAEVPELRA